MRRAAAVLSTLATAIAAVIVVSPSASAAVPRLQGRFDTEMRVTASTNGEPVGRTYTRVVSFTPQCSAGPCRTQLTRRRGDGKTISYIVTPTETGYTGQRTYLAHCRLRGGYIVTDAYSYTERLTLTPQTVLVDTDRVQTYTATMNLSFTPNARGRNWRCRAGSQQMTWDGTLRVPAP